MSYECCGSGEAAAAAASDALTASLSVVLRLLRFVYDYAGEVTVNLCKIIAALDNVTTVFVIFLLVLAISIIIIYAYLWLITGRIVISLSHIRDWLVGPVRGWKPIGETRSRTPGKVQRVAPSLGTNAAPRTYYYGKPNDENDERRCRDDGPTNDDVSSFADGDDAVLDCNTEVDGAAATAADAAPRLRRGVKEHRCLSGQ